MGDPKTRRHFSIQWWFLYWHKCAHKHRKITGARRCLRVVRFGLFRRIYQVVEKRKVVWSTDRSRVTL